MYPLNIRQLSALESKLMLLIKGVFLDKTINSSANGSAGYTGERAKCQHPEI